MTMCTIKVFDLNLPCQVKTKTIQILLFYIANSYAIWAEESFVQVVIRLACLVKDT